MWREVIEISRPKNVVLAALTVPLGAHLSIAEAWDMQAIGLVALQTICVMFFIGAGNVFNDISDYSIDKLSKPQKPITSGRITISSAKKTGYIFAALSALLMLVGIFLVDEPIPFAIVWLSAAGLMVTYDFGPKTKNSGLVGNVAISLMVGAVIIYGAATVSKIKTPLVLYAAIVAFFANLAREIVKDCEDIETDTGRNTLPMRIGLMNARATAYVFVLLSMVFLGLAHLHGPFEYHHIVFHAPAIFLLFSLNGPLFRGEDYKAQQQIRFGMLLGLIAFAAQVSIL